MKYNLQLKSKIKIKQKDQHNLFIKMPQKSILLKSFRGISIQIETGKKNNNIL